MECKVVVVGDSKCGKSALVHRFANDNFLTMYVPTDFERCSVDHLVGDYSVRLTIWDTSGAAAYDTVRPLCYKDARAFLVCFDLSSQMSLNNTLKKWLQEIRGHSEAPIILCGCQSDTRDEVKHPVTYEQATSISRQMNATGYVETSAKTEEGVTDAFELCALAALGKSRFASLVRRHAPHLKKHLRTHHQHKSCIIM
ncbi:Rho-related GTP-binding protein RhoE like protein [Argiope bruennichi]|uniref:Rho-related GTP-binding protein RhoE like protein n=1 Tax=Argiope bruennichi TaxID=94029 RepID=A0A8T0EFZ6_ARGBR|nr:Rho-related GTP-binding protein RhoE like protein [Argiope bruennichi]